MISYDTNVLIYALESSPKWSAGARQIVTQGEQEGAVLSVLVWQEILAGAAMRGAAVEGQLRQILDALVITEFVPVTRAIADQAVTLTRQFGRKIRGYDAILLATAIEHGTGVFWTNDQRLVGLEIEKLRIQALL